MALQRVSILGLGLIGGSIARSLKNSNQEYEILGFDKPEVLRKALKENVIDSGLQNIRDSLVSDIIFLCLPVDESLKSFENLIPLLKPGQIITDVCGVKSVFQEIWNRAGSKGIYAGGHPMTGKESSGFENSDPYLFENSVYILSENESNSGIEPLIQVIKLLGARIKFLNPKVHDIVVASVSHLPQLMAVSLINSASLKENDINFFDFAAGGFRDMTRIASSDYKIWDAVFRNNKKNVQMAIDNFINDLLVLKKLVTSGESESIAGRFENARIRRDEIPRNTKGFINSLFDLFINVKDEPGVLAKLTTLLFENGIDIKDLELLKVRQGSGGTFRISFETESAHSKAKDLLSNAGFTVT